jgi:23S rRNA (adenine1618-N6)-methyltransferase
MHKNNKHIKGYNFEVLCKAFPDLEVFVFTNKYNTKTIDFSDSKAVIALNTALLFSDYNISYWDFPDDNLCPPIPSRVDYIHHLAELLQNTKQGEILILDIGTGATCIYPLLGQSVYDWKFVATDIDSESLKNAQNIIKNNQLEDKITLRLQADKMHILKGVLTDNEQFTASMCNPPFYKSAQEAQSANSRKQNNLGLKTSTRNFSGTHAELWYQGGEKAFLHNYLYESSLYKSSCIWFTSLVSKKENVKSMYDSLKKLKATKIKTIDMQLGNKITRIVAWSFL